VGFETAVDELTDGTLAREDLAQILHRLRPLDTDPPAGPTLSEHDAALLDEADFGADPGAGPRRQAGSRPADAQARSGIVVGRRRVRTPG